MEDFPTRIADLLEQTARRIRGLTVDKVIVAVNWVAAAPIMLLFAIVGIVFVSVGLFRIIAEVTGGVRIAYAIVGGLFVVVGAFLWSQRLTAADEIGTSES